MKKLTNSNKLARRLGKLFRDRGNETYDLEARAIDEIIKFTVSAVAQLPSHHSRAIRQLNPDLFCPFCGALHSLPVCTHPGVSDYRRDPTAWMQSNIPSGIMQQLAHVEVKPKRVRSAPAQSKKMPAEEVKAAFEQLKEDVRNK